MKARKKMAMFAVLLAALAIMVTGCGGSSGLVGTWKDDRGVLTLELSRDGSGYSRWGNPAGFSSPEPPRGNITWEASGSTLIIRSERATFTGNFEIVGNSLVITDMIGHMNRTWTRQ